MTHTLLLRPEADRAAFHTLASRRGWRLVQQRPRAHEAFAGSWWTYGDGRQVSWTEDHTLGLRMVQVEDDALARELAELLPHHSLDGLREQALSEDPRLALRALRGLSQLERGGLTPRTRRRVLRLLDHEQEAVRRGVCLLIWSGAWTDLVGELRERVGKGRGEDELLSRLAEGLESLEAQSRG